MGTWDGSMTCTHGSGAWLLQQCELPTHPCMDQGASTQGQRLCDPLTCKYHGVHLNDGHLAGASIDNLLNVLGLCAI